MSLGHYPEGSAPLGASVPLSGGGTVAPPAQDTTAPVLSGTLNYSAVTYSGADLAWSAATDNVGVASYRYSVDTGTPLWQVVGNVLSVSAAGLAPSTAYTARVQASDAAGNFSNILTTSFTTAATPPVVDTSPPSFTGTISVSTITTSGATVSWPMAADNAGVSGYRYSIDTGTRNWKTTTSTSVQASGLLPNTTYTITSQAFDAAGNYSVALSRTFTTADSQVLDQTAPVMGGATAFSAITQNSVHAVWPAATDNVGVAGYQWSCDTGIPNWQDNGMSTSVDVSQLNSLTTYFFRTRARDAADNFSTATSRQFTTLPNSAQAGPRATRASVQLIDPLDAPRANLTNLGWAFFDQIPGQMGAPAAQGSNAVTDGSGNLVANITGSTLSPGAGGWLIVTDSDGNLLNFSQARVFSGMVGTT